MKKIMFFCIPAYGHHNPTLPVVAELVRRGNAVRYYSFEEFRQKVSATGAEFFPCDVFLPPMSKEQETAVKNVSNTEMSIVDLQTTGRMDGFLKEQVQEFTPDIIVSDSVCFWGKLTARKYGIPLVVSTTTFAFNKYSSQYMKSSFSEIWDLIRGSGRVKKELKALEQYGYHEKSIMPLVQSDNYTDSVVYATKAYQPCSDTFSKHYAFVGPSVFSERKPNKQGKPLVYVSLGTVINDRPDFYHKCIEALADEPVEVLISCGKAVDQEQFQNLPENVTVQPYVDQLEVLSRASVFLTHCGMNSVSESLYMATPMVLFPQTNEQRAVARRAGEMGAGVQLKEDSAEAIRDAVRTILGNDEYAWNAMRCSQDFRSAPGPKGAAEFIETAPHLMPEEDRKLRRAELFPGIAQLCYWLVMIPVILFLPKLTGVGSWWIYAIAANLLLPLYKNLTDKLAQKAIQL